VADSLEFERKVAAMLRALGAKVEHDTELAGNQVDVLLTETTSSGIPVRIAVECKAFSKQVGLGTTNFYVQLSDLLKHRNLIDKFAVVGLSGFTKNARKAAQTHGIELIEYADLLDRVAGLEAAVQAQETQIQSEQQRTKSAAGRKPRIFAVMPFNREFDDVFFLGIQEVGEKLGFVVERADLVEHSGPIMEMIVERIKRADVVVGDITNANANVLYEIGLAHANKIPTILIMRSGGEIPFDVRAHNVLFYENVTRLREALIRRLQIQFNPPIDDPEAG
jgi:hypothetical protein